MSGTLPTVVTSAGLQPQAPASLNAQLIALAESLSPGLTANLPGSLIDDVAGTDTAALVVCDQARVELVNSLTPFGANAWLLLQLGAIYGVPQGAATNTSVFVQFAGTVGYVIAQGFVVSDGTNQYAVSDGGVVGSGGVSPLLFAIATQPGSFAVPAATVVNLITSVRSGVTLTVTNPSAGTPGGPAESESDYRAAVLQAGLAASQGMAAYLKTLLGNVVGVQPRLVSVRQQGSGGWEIIVGGSGDPVQIGYAIYQALFDVSTLVGSILAVVSITNANPGVVTTTLNHGYSTGQVINIAGIVGMTELNNTPLTITVLTETTFSVGVDTTGFTAYSSGGIVTPNFRNIVTSIIDYPDTYNIPYVNPPQQTVSIVVTWNTTAPGFISSSAISQLAQPALANYVNSIPVGAPINQFELDATFQQAVASIVPTPLLTRLVWSVSINGIGTAPESGTGIIAGDPESYFFTTASAITVNRG